MPPRPSLTPSLLSTAATDLSTAAHHVPFYSTTFSAHRVSPLYLGGPGQPLDARRLQTLAQRLRDVLVGDVVRGVEVGLSRDEDGAMGRAGALEVVEMRMPAPLKEVVAEFLATAFDCRVSPLRLGTRSMVQGWEAWIRTAGLPTRGPLAKDVVLSLGFFLPPEQEEADKDESEDEEDRQLGLKSVEVFIPAAELTRFVDAGRAPSKSKAGPKAIWDDDIRKRRKLAGRMHEEGWEWRKESTDEDPAVFQPFTEALGRYIDHHMGLNLFHPGVRITKLACGGFVMSESRLKIFAPAGLGDAVAGGGSSSGQRKAVWELLRDLVQKARGQDLVS
ncbi:kinetochore complex Sim4 subunit Fta1-domain-containing protein [Schizothecium vesticola]|uniref:Kinetochore complex Sim4 subunit Fta1-domain-containing protein n=1 Tax=Schizothecium vesticola TaxID=314040 RepID=A0AA40EX18_9PEZI|nr:kinetochore complex Sim4 subunit Fta1-domain-containing protein [Schizothecium vesticola]